MRRNIQGIRKFIGQLKGLTMISNVSRGLKTSENFESLDRSSEMFTCNVWV